MHNFYITNIRDQLYIRIVIRAFMRNLNIRDQLHIMRNLNENVPQNWTSGDKNVKIILE